MIPPLPEPPRGPDELSIHARMWMERAYEAYPAGHRGSAEFAAQMSIMCSNLLLTYSKELHL